MLKKLSIAFAVVAALGLAFAAPTPVSAKDHRDQGGNNKRVHVRKDVHIQKNIQVHKDVHVRRNFVVGRKYDGHIWYGRSRHFWHGAWYDYGIGPCWINVGGLWFWNVAACPI